MLAKEAATLDVLSDGRMELGIGAGWLKEEYERAGIPFDAAGVRVARLEESLQIIKGLFEPSPLTFSGNHYEVANLESFPRSVQHPRPPILVGAGSKRMLGIAGREADIIGILPKALPNGTISEDISERSPETMHRKIEWVRAGAGERFPEIELNMVISFNITDDYKGAAEQTAIRRGWGTEGAKQVLDMPSHFIGSVDRIAEVIEERRELYGFSYFVVSDREMEAFGRVVERLSGR
jgi:probable F420-dependent oxidoreductase